MGLGKNLRSLREARGWTEMELWRRSGVSQSTINRFENDPDPNPNPKVQNLIKLARALDVTLDMLLGDELTGAVVDRMDDLEKRIERLERGRRK